MYKQLKHFSMKIYKNKVKFCRVQINNFINIFKLQKKKL